MNRSHALIATLLGAWLSAAGCGGSEQGGSGETPSPETPTVPGQRQNDAETCVSKRLTNASTSASSNELVSTGRDVFMTCTHSRELFQKEMPISSAQNAKKDQNL